MQMRNKKTILILLSVLIPVFIIFSFLTAKKTKSQTVSTSKVSLKNIAQSISVTGNISPYEQYVYNLNSAQKVAEIYVNEGQSVKKGDALIKLDTSDLEYQLKKAQLGYDSALINASNSRKQAEINLESAQRNYDSALNKFNINEELYNQGMISKEEYNTFKKALEDAKGQLELAKLQYENSDISSSSSPAAKQLQITKSDIENLKKRISESTLKSDIDGKVARLDAKLNQYPSMGDKIIIINTSSYKVNVEVSQYDAVNIKLNQKALIKVKGISREYTGKVSRIGQTAESVNIGTDTQSKVKVEVEIENADENIKSGYEADVSIILVEKNNVPYVGYEAVRQDSNGEKYVFAVENSRVVKKYIKTGIETDFDIEVISGLKEGDVYIPNPSDTVREGMIVNTGGSR